MLKYLRFYFSQSHCLYKTLGLSPGADSSAIKQAYYRLAQKLHPDRNPTESAREQFLKIKQAYQTLGDPSKRILYDGESKQQQAYSQKRSRTKRRDYSDAFAQFDDYFKIKREQQQSKPKDVVSHVSISFEESVLGVSQEISFVKSVVCERCKGHGNRQAKKAPRCFSCGGRGNITLRHGNQTKTEQCTHCQGTGLFIKNHCQLCHGEGLTSQPITKRVKIPKGIADGGMIKQEGEGSENRLGKLGSLFVFVKVQGNSRFRRDGNNIRSEESIGLAKAVLGGVVEVETVYGRVKVEVRGGTNSGDERRLVGMGFQSNISSIRGDHIIKFKVKIPVATRLTTQLYKELSQLQCQQD